MLNTLRSALLVAIVAMAVHAAVAEATGGSIVLGKLAAQYRTPPHASTMIEGDVRFQVLTPGLVRMEYSPTAHFIDAPSVAVLKRNWASVPFQHRTNNGWLEIDTGKMKVRYRPGSGQFTRKNLEVSWHDEQGQHEWKPGDKDEKNLGGVRAPDIAWRTQPGSEPGALSRNGYFLLDDSQTALWDSATEWVIPRPEQNDQDWYFFVYSYNYKELLRELSQLLGPVPMVPRYILGSWVGSRAGYSEDEWKMIANRFREEHIPADIIVLDSDSISKVVWSGYDIDRGQMPHPREFFQWMHQHGFRVTTNEHYGPLTRINDHHFETFLKLLNLQPNAKAIPYNLADKKFAQAFMELLHRPRLDMGMAFWWQDGWAGVKMRGLDPALWTRYVEYTGSQQITGKRAFVFCRLGSWGSHRFGGYFTGDLIPYWSTLNLLVPYDVQGGNMLVDYIVNLCAGVFQETVDPELYDRWVEFSSFSPVFWWHGLWGLRFPWEYGPESMKISRKFLKLRYRLLPYMYTYTRIAHDTGLPLVRGMYLDYPNQDASYTYRHQYMFGSELLASPITQPGYGKPVLKDTWLPPGENWFDYFTGKIYQGGQVIPYECPLDRMLLFVRAGSILPLAPHMQYSDQRPLDPLILAVYAGKPTSFRLYEDDGGSLDYRKGAYAWTPLTFQPEQGGTYKIEVGPCTGHYKGQLKSRRYKLMVHGLLQPRMVLINGQRLEEKRADACGQGCPGWTWNNELRITTIHVTDPIPVDQRVVLTLRSAGSFADAEMLQKIIDYRRRVRLIREEEQLKWAMLLHGLDIARPPRVVRETEQVEAQLDNMVSNSYGVGQHPPDFRGMTERLLEAFVDQPFESQRIIPDADPDHLKAARVISRGSFEPEEIDRMTAELLGCKLKIRVFGTPSPVVQAKLVYDHSAVGPAKVEYRIRLPQEGLPGWTETEPRHPSAGGYTEFDVRAPFLARRGKYPLTIMANLTWDGGQVHVVRNVEWVSLGGHAVETNNGFSIPNLAPTYPNGIMSRTKEK